MNLCTNQRQRGRGSDPGRQRWAGGGKMDWAGGGGKGAWSETDRGWDVGVDRNP